MNCLGGPEDQAVNHCSTAITSFPVFYSQSSLECFIFKLKSTKLSLNGPSLQTPFTGGLIPGLVTFVTAQKFECLNLIIKFIVKKW